MRPPTRQGSAGTLGIDHYLVLVALFLVASGCQQQMAVQPPYRPLKASTFFADGRSARPLVEGTVSRDGVGMRGDRAFYTGMMPVKEGSPEAAAGLIGAPGIPAVGAFIASAERAAFIDYLPFPAGDLGIMVVRGRQRFDIYCAVCHGRSGDGKGMIPRRGFTEPPSFHTGNARAFLLKGIKLPLREAPVGYFFEVITHGYGAMPDYRDQVPVGDRWAIISYIRALQVSRNLPLDKLSGRERQRLAEKLGPN
jgi:mono/diheme cytochrome c family protein